MSTGQGKESPDFSTETKLLLAFRSGLICSNPDCNTLTCGPVEGIDSLSTKIDEAAHIFGARKGSARFIEEMQDTERADITNGIWVCANCHTKVDKNRGTSYPSGLLKKWKDDHERMIKALIISNRSPLPVIRAMTEHGKYAQEIVDKLGDHGAFYQDFEHELPEFVDRGIDRVRQELRELKRKIRMTRNFKA